MKNNIITRGLFKAGKSVGKGWIRFGNFLEKAERRNQTKIRKLNRTTK